MIEFPTILSENFLIKQNSIMKDFELFNYLKNRLSKSKEHKCYNDLKVNVDCNIQ